MTKDNMGAGWDFEHVTTDNGSAYCSFRFRNLLTERGISMRKTRPYRPQTNGKAEAFVKIVSAEWTLRGLIALRGDYQQSAGRANHQGSGL